jgi:hypothetical protein
MTANWHTTLGINLTMDNKAVDLKFVRKFVLGLVHETP